MSVKLSPRLMTATKYVRGGVVADVGTDHAYLPIFLCSEGFLHGDGDVLAIASDINAGPVERASLHIRTAGLSDRIVTVQTNGLSGLDKYAPTDIIIFGMGGELIAAILEAAQWVRRDGIRLILQPMTHAEKLCSALATLGFAIVGNTYSQEGDRLYRTICADYAPDFAQTDYSDAELLLGLADGLCTEQYKLYLSYAKKHLTTLTARQAAKAASGVNTSDEDGLIAEINEIILKGESQK
ncbi:MAG: SAM-dependent methyltransferase [Clostridia bacterium]|nr:SAM-dependent methyltransferase [Clostridia bacterium]